MLGLGGGVSRAYGTEILFVGCVPEIERRFNRFVREIRLQQSRIRYLVLIFRDLKGMACSTAPKGRNTIAQGNALGEHAASMEAPTGRDKASI